LLKSSNGVVKSLTLALSLPVEGIKKVACFVIPSVVEESPYRLGRFLDKLEMTTRV
jgi:hypothetical protein